MKKLINFKLKAKNQLFARLKYDSTIHKLKLDPNKFDRIYYGDNKVFKSDNLFFSNYKPNRYSTKDLEINYKYVKILEYNNFIFDYFKIIYLNLWFLTAI